MTKKALQLASVASMIDQFNMPNIQILQSLGYEVDVVANFTNPGSITKERAEDLRKRLANMNVRVFDIAIPRSLNPRAVFSSYKKVKKLISSEHYNLIHCHSPIGGVICRKAAKSERKNGTKVIYTAHGFHFYNGAPLKNWVVYYPIEKHLSRYTDVLITINREDYKRATEKFYAKKTVYIPGVGIDTEKFAPNETKRVKIRKELGISDDKVMLLSVGELNNNKNHSSVIKAIKGIPNITYVIVGKGEKADELIHLAKELSVDLRLTGFRSDVADFYSAADVYILPSIREGLNVSLMEAMASGVACCCGQIRGNVDIIRDKNVMFSPMNSNDIKKSIDYCINERKNLSRVNYNQAKAYDAESVNKIVFKMYHTV